MVYMSTFKVTRRALGGGASPALASASSGETLVVVAGKRHVPVAVIVSYASAVEAGMISAADVRSATTFERPDVTPEG